MQQSSPALNIGRAVKPPRVVAQTAFTQGSGRALKACAADNRPRGIMVDTCFELLTPCAPGLAIQSQEPGGSRVPRWRATGLNLDLTGLNLDLTWT